MFHTMVRIIALFAVFAAPVASLAHDGHAHKVMGTVAAISATQLEVKTTDGKKEIVSLSAKTVYRQGKAKSTLKALKVGDRVVVEGTQGSGAKTITATVVQMAEAPVATAAAPAPRAPAR
jgi:hypothetical protein